jgi:hypothetical protein
MRWVARVDLYRLEKSMNKLSPTVEEIEALRATAPVGPVVMINLLKFLPNGGREAYRRYIETATRASVDAGTVTKVIYNGTAGPDVANGEDWDYVIVVEYACIDDYANLMVHPIYQHEAIPIRKQALSKALFMASFPSALTSIWD